MMNFSKISDKELYSICKKWGSEALEARRKFAGLLPEVWKRERAAHESGGSWLKKRGFTCLYEFAAKLAGMSREQVDLVVRMERRFEDKPILHEALVSGAVSPHKLARVVSIATMENQREILRRVETLSKVALEVFVKDVKLANEKSDGLFEGKSVQTSLPGQTFKLAEDVDKELREMEGRGIDVNALLRQFLKDRREKLAERKEIVGEKHEKESEDRALIGFPAKRYVPAEVRKIVKEEFGDRCAVFGCSKRAENLHHVKAFAKGNGHDPRFLKPLCRGHHELEHVDSG
jgi:hypothetical protein